MRWGGEFGSEEKQPSPGSTLQVEQREPLCRGLREKPAEQSREAGGGPQGKSPEGGSSQWHQRGGMTTKTSDFTIGRASVALAEARRCLVVGTAASLT